MLNQSTQVNVAYSTASTLRRRGHCRIRFHQPRPLAGRRVEDGAVPFAYNLRETLATDYSVRTKLNVRDSDGTVVFTRGAAEGGSALTIDYARSIGRPVLHIDLALVTLATAAICVRAWCAEHEIRILNVAGSRDSQAPGIGATTHGVLMRALAREPMS